MSTPRRAVAIVDGEHSPARPRRPPRGRRPRRRRGPGRRDGEAARGRRRVRRPPRADARDGRCEPPARRRARSVRRARARASGAPRARQPRACARRAVRRARLPVLASADGDRRRADARRHRYGQARGEDGRVHRPRRTAALAIARDRRRRNGAGWAAGAGGRPRAADARVAARVSRAAAVTPRRTTSRLRSSPGSRPSAAGVAAGAGRCGRGLERRRGCRSGALALARPRRRRRQRRSAATRRCGPPPPRDVGRAARRRRGRVSERLPRPDRGPRARDDGGAGCAPCRAGRRDALAREDGMPVVRAVLRPRPLEPNADARVAFFCTAPPTEHSASPGISTSCTALVSPTSPAISPTADGCGRISRASTPRSSSSS